MNDVSLARRPDGAVLFPLSTSNHRQASSMGRGLVDAQDHDHYHGFVRQQVREKMDQADGSCPRPVGGAWGCSWV